MEENGRKKVEEEEAERKERGCAPLRDSLIRDNDCLSGGGVSLL